MFPLQGLSGILALITTINPLSFVVDGLRGTLIGLSHFGLVTDFTVLGITTFILLILGSYLFSKIQI